MPIPIRRTVIVVVAVANYHCYSDYYYKYGWLCHCSSRQPIRLGSEFWVFWLSSMCANSVYGSDEIPSLVVVQT